MQATAKSSLTHVSTAMTATCHSQLKARCWQVLLSATFIGRGLHASICESCVWLTGMLKVLRISSGVLPA